MAEMTLPQGGAAIATPASETPAIPTAEAAQAGLTPEQRMEIVRQLEQAVAAGDLTFLDGVVLEAAKQQGVAVEIDMARGLAEAFRDAKKSGDTVKAQEAQQLLTDLSTKLQETAAQSATAGAGAQTDPATGATQVAAGAANEQVVTGAAAAPGAASAAVATADGQSAAAGVDGANAGAMATSQAPATDQKDAAAVLQKLGIEQQVGGKGV